jgi:cytosine/uracil/thiamine/allantoin permease
LYTEPLIVMGTQSVNPSQIISAFDTIGRISTVNARVAVLNFVFMVCLGFLLVTILLTIQAGSVPCLVDRWA